MPGIHHTCMAQSFASGACTTGINIPSHEEDNPAHKKPMFGRFSRGRFNCTHFHRHLRGAIIRGELHPGQALSESEIAGQYSTSRQPVREGGFIKLAEERLVTIQPQRGAFVVKISVADVLDARFVREAISGCSAGGSHLSAAHRHQGIASAD